MSRQLVDSGRQLFKFCKWEVAAKAPLAPTLGYQKHSRTKQDPYTAKRALQIEGCDGAWSKLTNGRVVSRGSGFVAAAFLHRRGTLTHQSIVT